MDRWSKQIERRKTCMKVVNVICILILIPTVTQMCLVASDFWVNLYTAELAVIGLGLVFAVIRIRSTVKHTIFAHPNEKLVFVHAINFIVWGVLWLIQSLVYIEYDHRSDTSGEDQIEVMKINFASMIITTILTVYEVYMNIFLLYIILRFAKQSRNAEMYDGILGKKVPCLVYVMNQRILAKTIDDIAEMNEN